MGDGGNYLQVSEYSTIALKGKLQRALGFCQQYLLVL